MTDGLTLRRLEESDVTAVQRLIEADPDYTQRVSGSPPGPDEAHRLLTARPATLAPDQKVVLGVFCGTGLVALIDLLRGWPDAGTVHIGLLQVHPQHQGQGIGRRAHDLLLDWIHGWPEVTQLRAAIVETNAEHAAPFWQALGYTAFGPPKPYEQGAVSTTVRLWTRPVVSSIQPVKSRPSPPPGAVVGHVA
ncbi:GNAT family N-acetyltransferase [Nocardioides marmoribigeumensis]|uniref:RimJ/RimL family protein N-acetyltransferase n=1 Tax=Nocardioides marmoribigeumensis TaxID=433649 RepID=A0ABU2C0H2_9ACTN|nr:GNAT family N-acetyltransferase [Nocardioides marmoribigeumensis]MDR7364177.1 RimJ/RimL family protein N-acetyltransferase [Nocardioides marmoribigeumensis]